MAGEASRIYFSCLVFYKGFIIRWYRHLSNRLSRFFLYKDIARRNWKKGRTIFLVYHANFAYYFSYVPFDIDCLLYDTEKNL